MADQRALDFRGPEPMAGAIQNVVDAPDDPEISILVPPRAVSGEVAAFELAPVLFPVTRLVAIERSQHRGPGLPDNQFAADIRSHLISLFIHDRRVDAKKRQRCAS